MNRIIPYVPTPEELSAEAAYIASQARYDAFPPAPLPEDLISLAPAHASANTPPPPSPNVPTIPSSSSSSSSSSSYSNSSSTPPPSAPASPPSASPSSSYSASSSPSGSGITPFTTSTAAPPPQAPPLMLHSTPALPLGTAQPPPLLDLASCAITAADLNTRVLPRRRCLLDSWLCAGDLGFVFGSRGIGKTWLGTALPLAISRGTALGLWQAGDAPPEGGVRVLCVDGEMPMELTQARSRGMELATGNITYLHHDTLFHTLGTSLNIGDAHHRESLTRLLISGGYQVLVLDNLSSLASGVDENKALDYEPISLWLLELRRREFTTLVLHHAGRNGFMRGSTKREDACSWILELRDAKQDDEPGAKFTTHFAKPSRNTGHPTPDLLWHFTSTEDGKTNIQCEYSVKTEYEQFIGHVLEGVENQSDIADIMNKPKGTISKWAAKALQEKRLRGNSRKLLPPIKPEGTSSPYAYKDADDYEDDP